MRAERTAPPLRTHVVLFLNGGSAARGTRNEFLSSNWNEGSTKDVLSNLTRTGGFWHLYQIARCIDSIDHFMGALCSVYKCKCHYITNAITLQMPITTVKFNYA